MFQSVLRDKDFLRWTIRTFPSFSFPSFSTWFSISSSSKPLPLSLCPFFSCLTLYFSNTGGSWLFYPSLHPLLCSLLKGLFICSDVPADLLHYVIYGEREQGAVSQTHCRRALSEPSGSSRVLYSVGQNSLQAFEIWCEVWLRLVTKKPEAKGLKRERE